MFKLYIGCNHSLKAQLGHSKQISCFPSIARIPKLEVGAAPSFFNDCHRSRLRPLCNQVFRANGGHVVERGDIRPLLLQNAAAVDHLWVGDDRMKSLLQVVWAFHFNEVPVKVQISCNLEPCCFKKLIIITARMHEEAIPMQDGETENYLEWPYINE